MACGHVAERSKRSNYASSTHLSVTLEYSLPFCVLTCCMDVCGMSIALGRSAAHRSDVTNGRECVDAKRYTCGTCVCMCIHVVHGMYGDNTKDFLCCDDKQASILT